MLLHGLDIFMLRVHAHADGRGDTLPDYTVALAQLVTEAPPPEQPSAAPAAARLPLPRLRAAPAAPVTAAAKPATKPASPATITAAASMTSSLDSRDETHVSESRARAGAWARGR